MLFLKSIHFKNFLSNSSVCFLFLICYICKKRKKKCSAGGDSKHFIFNNHSPSRISLPWISVAAFRRHLFVRFLLRLRSFLPKSKTKATARAKRRKLSPKVFRTTRKSNQLFLHENQFVLLHPSHHQVIKRKTWIIVLQVQKRNLQWKSKLLFKQKPK